MIAYFGLLSFFLLYKFTLVPKFINKIGFLFHLVWLVQPGF